MKTNKLLRIPRVLAIVFIVYISLFALDIFSSSELFDQKLIGFLIHLIPSFILIIILIISWEKPFIGGIIFIFLGVILTSLMITFSVVHTPHPGINFVVSQILIIPLPLILIGLLFIIFRKHDKCIKIE
jgi:hypothetical protein